MENNKNIPNEHSDKYDYLDNVLGDFFEEDGGEETNNEIKKDVKINNIVKENTSEANNSSANIDGGKKKRTPLFNFLIEETDIEIENKNDVNGEQASEQANKINSNHVEEKENIAIENIEDSNKLINRKEMIDSKDSKVGKQVKGLLPNMGIIIPDEMRDIGIKDDKQTSVPSDKVEETEADKVEETEEKIDVGKLSSTQSIVEKGGIYTGIKDKWKDVFVDEDGEEDEDEEDGEEDEDNFDSLFEDLLDDDRINNTENVVKVSKKASKQVIKNREIIEEVKNIELDKDVIVPLEKEGMGDIKVTRDGKTLTEMLPSIRGGNRKSEQVLSEIKNQKRVIKVDEKKFSDNRYTKHIENAEKKDKENRDRKKYSNTFIQKYARFTEQEKIILNNLGLSSGEFGELMKSTELTKKEKEEIIGLGVHGVEKHFKGRRYKTTMGDTALLEFLTKFKFANTRILRWINHESQNTTFQKLKRLENNGLIENKSIIGVPDLWGATLSGVGLAGYSLKPGLKPMPKMQTISSSMGVNYLAACLWFNTINVLDLDDFPANNRLVGLNNGEFKRVRGEELVSELEIRSSLGKEINPYSSTMQNLGDERLYDVISANVRTEFEEWERNGKQGTSPEEIAGNEYMWVLYPTSQLTLSYHVPDLVVKRERGPNGEPRSIAVELERHTKTNDRYDKIMLAYKLDEHLYEKVIWVTPNKRSARALAEAADSVGFDRFEIIPIMTENGAYTKSDIWLI